MPPLKPISRYVVVFVAVCAAAQVARGEIDGYIYSWNNNGLGGQYHLYAYVYNSEADDCELADQMNIGASATAGNQGIKNETGSGPVICEEYHEWWTDPLLDGEFPGGPVPPMGIDFCIGASYSHSGTTTAYGIDGWCEVY